MKALLSKGWPLVSVVMVLFAGCATPFTPAKYVVDPNRPYAPHTQKTVLLVTAFDRTGVDAPGGGGSTTFNPSAYLTGVLEQELTAGGIHFKRLEGSYDPSFGGVARGLADGTIKAGGDVVLTASINAFPNDFILSCDFRVYSAKGQLLFEKRGLCMNFSVTSPAILEQNETKNLFNLSAMSSDPKVVEANKLKAPRMVMQQLFGDPDFQKAIQ